MSLSTTSTVFLNILVQLEAIPFGPISVIWEANPYLAATSFQGAVESYKVSPWAFSSPY